MGKGGCIGCAGGYGRSPSGLYGGSPGYGVRGSYGRNFYSPQRAYGSSTRGDGTSLSNYRGFLHLNGGNITDYKGFKKSMNDEANAIYHLSRKQKKEPEEEEFLKKKYYQQNSSSSPVIITVPSSDKQNSSPYPTRPNSSNFNLPQIPPPAPVLATSICYDWFFRPKE